MAAPPNDQSVTDHLITHFAPPERAPGAEVERQHRLLLAQPLAGPLLDSFPCPAVVLNRERQAVLANAKLEQLAGAPGRQLLGLRPGEILDCAHAHEQAAGCGTSRFCRYCGAAQAILGCQQLGETEVEECRIRCHAGGGGESALDLQVWTTPLAIADERFTVFAISDVTDAKRRQVLERIFFHDVLNSAGGLLALLGMLPEADGEEREALARDALRLSQQLHEEIQAQRDLAAAERGELQVDRRAIEPPALLEELCADYRRHPVADGKELAVRVAGDAGITLVSDPLLVRRVLGNLVKNALEASTGGQTVTVAYAHDGGGERGHRFSVHNEEAMTEEVQRQIFNRSFSTKGGAGRGLGTYSIKLLAETYLEGEVEFASTPAAGTTFTVTLP